MVFIDVKTVITSNVIFNILLYPNLYIIYFKIDIKNMYRAARKTDIVSHIER